jgi:diaminopimelate epimerase
MDLLKERDKTIVFSKMSGHGNDFIILDNRLGSNHSNWKECASQWCERHTSIGADGLLVIEPSAIADFRLRIFNADGSEAEMCGNGARCAARFAVEHGIADSFLSFETLAGIIKARVVHDRVSINLTDPSELRGEVTLNSGDSTLVLFPINSGVPHVIIFRDCVIEMSADEVNKIGKYVRYHKVFEPNGTNVDFVEVMGPRLIRVRTYERGVESETMACGTGAVASAIISHIYKTIGDPPIAVQMPGGVMVVDFQKEKDYIKDVWLMGDVKWSYEGEIIGVE